MHGNNTKLTATGALVALAGYLLSGPGALLIIKNVQPQPPWTSARVFVEHYHPIQDLPYYFGFLLIGGMLMLMAGHYLHASATGDRRRFLAGAQRLGERGRRPAFCLRYRLGDDPGGIARLQRLEPADDGIDGADLPGCAAELTQAHAFGQEHCFESILWNMLQSMKTMR